MTILVAGASGATGKLLVAQLLTRGHHVKVLVRPSSSIPDYWRTSGNISIIHANITHTTAEELAEHLGDCHAVVSCLGHTLTPKGVFGKPRRLVTNSVRLLCDAIGRKAPGKPVRVVLMNTAGNRNRDLREPISIPHRLVISLLRLLVPPHPDNEGAADYLRVSIGQHHSMIEWVVVRPDSLIDEDSVTDYSLHASPVRSPIFDPGKTSRVNVADFMARLMTEPDLWDQWKGKMPVIYNTER